MQTLELPYDIETAAPEVQERFLSLIEQGNSPRLAEMLALRQPPASNTEREFLDANCRRGSLLDQMGGHEDAVAHRVAVARAHGLNVTANSHAYCPEIAPSAGHPFGWISKDNARGDYDRALAMMNMRKTRDGDIEHTPEEVTYTPLAGDIVNEAVRDMLAAGSREDVRELQQAAIERHGVHGIDQIIGQASSATDGIPAHTEYLNPQ